jgi:hypothetical protein
MLIIKNEGMERLKRATLGLEPKEALELIEKLSYLLRDPDFHHDHLREDPESSLDFFVINPERVETYHHDLRPHVEAVLRRPKAS